MTPLETLRQRVDRIYGACCGPAPKQAIGEMLRALVDMPEWVAEPPPQVSTNRDGTVGVDRDYHWLPMETCPRGVKLQLKGRSGVALYAKYDGKDPWWVGWAPLPTEKPNGAS